MDASNGEVRRMVCCPAHIHNDELGAEHQVEEGMRNNSDSSTTTPRRPTDTSEVRAETTEQRGCSTVLATPLEAKHPLLAQMGNARREIRLHQPVPAINVPNWRRHFMFIHS